LSAVEDLLDHFRTQLLVPWRDDVPAAGRVWLLWYDKSLERRVRGRIEEFRLATEATGRGWHQYDVAPVFAEWIAAQPWFERIAKRPSQLERVIPDFESELATRLRGELRGCGASDLMTVTGVASLFGLTRASSMIAKVASTVRGRMMVTFPGTHVNGIYRLLDARDGWNYHAIPIPTTDAG
jgi:hypothetical protein